MKAIFSLAAVAVVLPLGLSADDTQRPVTFQQLDMNKDGYVSIIEATGHDELLKKWSEVDEDTDGRLEMTEFSAFEVNPTFVPDPDDEEIGAAPHN